MPFSLSGGLSEMGKSVANTAGDMILNSQRAELDRQRIQLAESLAEGRETRGRAQAAALNEAAADKDRGFRAGESILNREHDETMLDKRETGEDRRARLSANTQIGIHNSSEANAESRFEQEMQFRVNQAQEAATDKKQIAALNAAIAANTTTVEQPYTAADGTKASRPMNVLNAAGVAASLRESKVDGLEDMVKIFAPKAENKIPAVPPAITGRVGLQWNPQLGLFRDASGAKYDKSGKPVK